MADERLGEKAAAADLPNHTRVRSRILDKTEVSSEMKNDGEAGEQQQDDTETSEPTPEEILHAAVCKALVTLPPKEQLPMLMSTSYASHVLPNRPAGTTIELKQDTKSLETTSPSKWMPAFWKWDRPRKIRVPC